MKKEKQIGLWPVALCMLTALAAVHPVQADNHFAAIRSAKAVHQNKIQVSGSVKDANGEPLIGVSIMVKGTTTGTITDYDGNFTIEVPQDATLVFTYVGYKNTEMAVNGQKTMNVTMNENSLVMNEVVVIGYGTQKKADVTSAVASVKSESFNKGAVLDAGQLVQGKVAGLQISLPSGDPSGSSTIMMRGTSSLKGSSQPLILVDGVPGTLSTVAPEEIESIDVLKDGSATAIYGTRGTNGVIIITTKGSTRELPTTIDYNGYMSLSVQSKRADFMKAGDLRKRWDEGFKPSGANDQDYNASTDWMDEISRTGISHVHNLTFRGGNKQTSLLGNLTYDKRQGTFVKSDSKNIRGRFELTHRMFDNKLTTNLALIANELKTSPGFNKFVYRCANIQNPTQPVYNEDGSYMERSVYQYDNPVSLLNEITGDNRHRNIRFTGSMTYRPWEELSLKAMITRIGQSMHDNSYTTKKHPNNTESGYNGYAYRFTRDYINDLVELTADWHKTIGKHSLGAIVGYNYEKKRMEDYSLSNRNFPTDSYTYNKLEAGKGLKEGTASMESLKTEEKLIGLFGRLTYNYDDRYLLMFSLRHEGSSKFGDDHKWGTFPGISAGWRLNNERFMKDIKWLDNLKLRAGFGVTGINIGDPYESQESLNYEGYFLYDDKWIGILSPVRNPNPELHWEKKYEYNIGLDFDILNGRLGGAIDLYLRDTKDALWDYSVPVPPYQFNTITANVGKIRNKGLEILINAVPVRTKDFEWNTSLSYSTNTNKIVSISNDKFTMSTDWFSAGWTGEPIQTSTHRVKVGEPIGNIFGLKSVGVDKDGKWIVERLKRDDEGNTIGKYYDLAENATDEDRQVLGNGVPKHYLNFNNSFRYKGLDLSINMRGQMGYQILNYQEMFYANPTIQYNVLNSAFDPHPVVEISADGSSFSRTGETARINDAQRLVSEYVEKGNFWKIDNVTIGYTFNMSKVKYIQNLRIYASCLNLLTLTSYKGVDPEVDITGLTAGTDERDKYPTIRSFTFGLNVTF